MSSCSSSYVRCIKYILRNHIGHNVSVELDAVDDLAATSPIILDVSKRNKRVVLANVTADAHLSIASTCVYASCEY